MNLHEGNREGVNIGMFLTIAKGLGKYVYKKINDRDILSKAIEATCEDLNYTAIPIRDILFSWYGSKELNCLVDQFNAGQRELSENDFELLVNSFIEATDFYLDLPDNSFTEAADFYPDQLDITKQGARQILLTFSERLREELLKAKDGRVVLANRLEEITRKSIDAGQQNTRELMRFISNEMTRLALVSSVNTEDADRIKPEDGLARKILRVEEILRHTHGPEGVKEASQVIEGLMRPLSKELERGSADAAVKASIVEKLIDRLIKEDEGPIHLLQERSKLREQRGHWDEAAADLQKLLNSSDNISPSVLTQAGILLITLGNWNQARELIQRGLEDELDPAVHLRAQEILLWIHDYQGRHDLVDEQCSRLLNVARDVDPAVEAGIEHRWGRATFEVALVTNDRELMEISLKRLLSARDRAIRTAGFANPFHANWIYRVSDALGTRDSRTRWEEAKQSSEEFGGPLVAHIRLSEADRAVRDENWIRAVDLLTEAQQLWKNYPYLKGSFDASYKLGRVYRELGINHQIDAVMNLRLAARIGARLKLPKVVDAKKQLNVITRGLSPLPQHLIREADERIKEQSFSRLLRGWSFTIPDSNKLKHG